MKDYVIREVPGYGYLPIVQVDGVEVYRGEFKETANFALAACINWDDNYE